MFRLAIECGRLERRPMFPKRVEENPPRQGFFEHPEYLQVRAELPWHQLVALPEPESEIADIAVALATARAIQSM